ncbi:MAG: type I restriction endonuclease subunit R [Anaerolineae bacterium]|nr:type I restriction endonuclease subunit R [Anaerolineae bacterium]
MSYGEAYRELVSSQLPALHLLTTLGWQYLPPADALRLRGGKQSAVLLEGVLRNWLHTHQHITYKNRQHDFSEANLDEALRRLKDFNIREGLLPASAMLYELLTLGTSLDQTIDGDRGSFTLRYIDWQNPTNNVYHVTDEFPVERLSAHDTRRPDIVLFVNGIPLAVIECKRKDTESKDGDPVTQAIEQTIRNQKLDEIPHLFVYTQLLLAVQPNSVRYGTTGTAKKFWAVWKEETSNDALDGLVSPLINRPLSAAEQTALYDWREDAPRLRQHFAALGTRLPTEQDRVLYSLLRPERLLELGYQYLVYDNGDKKITRYQQYFAIKATLARVLNLNAQGTRTGGVIWHTTGSGKSLTMVMLAKALALHIPNPRVVLVTDRVDLDTQIWNTFKACGKTVYKADSGADLIALVRGSRADIITTVIDKFETVAGKNITDDSPNVFLLVDESHRSQYGISHAKMKSVFTRGCYIGFTGTPLLKKDKTTAERFGGFIHKYTMRQAVEDEAVARLLYEGRLVDLNINRDQLDLWFERRTANLNDEQKLDLKRKMSRNEEVHRVDQRLQTIAFDIADHYRKNWRGSGYKAQLATASKEQAIQYFDLLKDEGIDCAVIISAPDTREGSEEIDSSKLPIVQDFWKQMMKRYGSEEAYNKEILASFHRDDGLELLIVVDKLLVGFDEPRNTVLYIDKTLREHGILQAIARVNRLFEGKDFGHIVDYRGVLGKLNEAMQVYNQLEAYDAEDVAGVVTDVSAVVQQLPHLHSLVWDVFKAVANKRDTEAMERLLEPEDRRHAFYDALNEFARVFKLALGVVDFHQQIPPARIKQYKDDLIYWHQLRTAVKQRYAETVNYGEYEQKIRAMMNDHVHATGVQVLVDALDIFDAEQFDAAVERLTSSVAQADTIASHVKRTATEKLEQDPAFYRKLSQFIDETIQAYKQGRIDEVEYLKLTSEAQAQILAGHAAGLPPKLRSRKHAPAYFGSLQEIVKDYRPADGDTAFDAALVDLAIACEDAIERLKIRDWATNLDVEKRMRNAVEDLLYDLRAQTGVLLKSAEMDMILDNLMEVAKKREGL